LKEGADGVGSLLPGVNDYSRERGSTVLRTVKTLRRPNPSRLIGCEPLSPQIRSVVGLDAK